jgi:hypothetical protein
MIITKGLLTDVEFSKTKENGVIAVGVKEQSVTLQQLTIPHTVGSNLKDNKRYIEDLPCVRLNFYNKESVDVVMEALKCIKENMNFPYGTIPLVC